MSISKINEKVAVSLTRWFGSIWVFYMFIVYGLLPLLSTFHPYQDTFLYWSNFLQLIALPLLLVGTNILGRDAEVRAKLDHEKLAESYDEQIAIYQEQKIIYQDLVEMMKKQEALILDVQQLNCHHPANPANIIDIHGDPV